MTILLGQAWGLTLSNYYDEAKLQDIIVGNDLADAKGGSAFCQNDQITSSCF